MSETTDAPREPQGSTSADSVVERRSGTADVGLRPEVAAFAWLMEEALRKHDGDRGPKGWQGDDVASLICRVQEEVSELVAVWAEYENDDQAHGRNFFGMRYIPMFAKEAADVANFAMMIADVVGALVAPMHRLQLSGAADVGDARGVLGYVVVGSGFGVRPWVAERRIYETREEAERAVAEAWGDRYTVEPVGAPAGPHVSHRWTDAQTMESGRDVTETMCWHCEISIDDDAASHPCPTVARSPGGDAPAERGWRPIATAPKDGTDILLWEKWGDVPFVGFWHAEGRWSYRSDHLYVNGDASLDPNWNDLTHWQPLPAPPVPAEEDS